MTRYHYCTVCRQIYECDERGCHTGDNQVGGICSMECWFKWYEVEREARKGLAY